MYIFTHNSSLCVCITHCTYEVTVPFVPYRTDVETAKLLFVFWYVVIYVCVNHQKHVYTHIKTHRDYCIVVDSRYQKETVITVISVWDVIISVWVEIRRSLYFNSSASARTGTTWETSRMSVYVRVWVSVRVRVFIYLQTTLVEYPDTKWEWWCDCENPSIVAYYPVGFWFVLGSTVNTLIVRHRQTQTERKRARERDRVRTRDNSREREKER